MKFDTVQPKGKDAHVLSRSSIWSKWDAALIVIFLLAMFTPLLFAKLWLIDDHEIVSFLALLRNDGWSGLWQVLTSIGDFGSMTRFRPIYYVIRLIEIFFWGENVYLWVLIRFGVALFFALSLYKLSQRVLSKKSSLILTLLMLVAPWTQDIFFRLGPNECYAIFFIGAILNILSKKNISWISISLCITVLVGIKENFYILIPLQLWVVYEAWKKDRKFHAMFGVILLMISIGCVGVLAYKLINANGMDVYEKSIGQSRMSAALNSLFSKKGGVVIAAIIFCLIVILKTTQSNSRRVGINAFLICLAIMAYNIYFYAEIPGVSSRYAIPFWPILLSMSIYSLILVINKLQIYLSLNQFIVKNVVTLGLVVLILIQLWLNVLKSYEYTTKTNQGYLAVKEVARVSKSFRDIVVNVSNVFDYEPALSIKKFIDFYQVNNLLFISVDKNIIEKSNLDSSILESLHSIEKNGGSGFSSDVQRTYDRLSCLEIFFNEQATPVCDARIKVVY